MYCKNIYKPKLCKLIFKVFKENILKYVVWITLKFKD